MTHYLTQFVPQWYLGGVAIIESPNMDVFGLWEDSGVPGNLAVRRWYKPPPSVPNDSLMIRFFRFCLCESNQNSWKPRLKQSSNHRLLFYYILREILIFLFHNMKV